MSRIYDPQLGGAEVKIFSIGHPRFIKASIDVDVPAVRTLSFSTIRF